MRKKDVTRALASTHARSHVCTHRCTRTHTHTRTHAHTRTRTYSEWHSNASRRAQCSSRSKWWTTTASPITMTSISFAMYSPARRSVAPQSGRRGAGKLCWGDGRALTLRSAYIGIWRRPHNTYTTPYNTACTQHCAVLCYTTLHYTSHHTHNCIKAYCLAKRFDCMHCIHCTVVISGFDYSGHAMTMSANFIRNRLQIRSSLQLTLHHATMQKIICTEITHYSNFVTVLFIFSHFYVRSTSTPSAFDVVRRYPLRSSSAPVPVHNPHYVAFFPVLSLRSLQLF